MSAVPPHPNVVRILGACAEPGHLCVVTEYCALGDVRELIKSPKRPIVWTFDIVLRLGMEAAEGMAHLHDHGITHRDLKSRNLLVNEAGTAKVADFGLAVVKEKSTRMQRTRMMNTSVGTAGWMAPELIEDSDGYTNKVDIYAFGITLWEMASLR